MHETKLTGWLPHRISSLFGNEIVPHKNVQLLPHRASHNAFHLVANCQLTSGKVAFFIRLRGANRLLGNSLPSTYELQTVSLRKR